MKTPLENQYNLEPLEPSNLFFIFAERNLPPLHVKTVGIFRRTTRRLLWFFVNLVVQGWGKKKLGKINNFIEFSSQNVGLGGGMSSVRFLKTSESGL